MQQLIQCFFYSARTQNRSKAGDKLRKIFLGTMLLSLIVSGASFSSPLNNGVLQGNGGNGIVATAYACQSTSSVSGDHDWGDGWCDWGDDWCDWGDWDDDCPGGGNPPPVATGSITVCKVIVNASGTIVNGSDFPGDTFTVQGFVPDPVTSDGAAVGTLPTTTFTTPLNLNAKLLGSTTDNNAECVTYSNLVLDGGGYYYSTEQLSEETNWQAPKYNDQFSAIANSISDFFAYGGELFDDDPYNDNLRNKNADGNIILTSAQPNRTLVVLNREVPLQPTSTPPLEADLSVTKSVDNASPHEGDTIGYTLTVSALGPATSTGVVATDTLPVGLTFVSASSPIGTYASSTGTWTIGDLPASSTATLQIAAQVNASSGTTITNSVVAGESSSLTDPNPSNNSSTVTITVAPPVVPGSYCTLAVSDATNLLSDGSPAALVATPYNGRWTAAIPGATWIWSSPAVENPSINESSTFTKTFAIADPLASTTLTINADNGYVVWINGIQVANNQNEVNYSASDTAMFDIAPMLHAGTNTFTATVTNFGIPSSTPQDNPAGLLYGVVAEGSCPTPTIPNADLSLTKTVDDTNPKEGDTIGYTLTVSALGPATSTGVVATDTLPVGLTFVSASSPIGTYASSTGTWTIGDLPASSTATLLITATVNAGTAGTTITNSAVVGEDANTTDPDTANNSSTASITVANNGGEAPTLTISPTTLPDGTVGSPYSELLTATGITGGTFDWSVATGTLPSGLTLGTSTGATTTIAGTPTATGTFPFTIGVVNGTASTSQAYVILVNAATSTPDSADVAITKTVDNANPNGGDTVTYTLTATDLGSVTSTYVVANDTLPGGLSFNSATISQGTYNMSTGEWNIGTISPNATTTLVISATVDPRSAGTTITNTATISELSSLVDDKANNSSSVSIAVKAAPCTSNCGGGGGGGTSSGVNSGNGNSGPVYYVPSAGNPPPPGGQVLGASTSCGIYLYSYIKLGANNDPNEVKKLQTFLNNHMGANLPVTGFYGPLTYRAVEQFQVKYHSDVLAPWVPHGLQSDTTPTGYVYKTTQRWINHIVCSELNLPLPQLP